MFSSKIIGCSQDSTKNQDTSVQCSTPGSHPPATTMVWFHSPIILATIPFSVLFHITGSYIRADELRKCHSHTGSSQESAELGVEGPAPGFIHLVKMPTHKHKLRAWNKNPKTNNVSWSSCSRKFAQKFSRISSDLGLKDDSVPNQFFFYFWTLNFMSGYHSCLIS